MASRIGDCLWPLLERCGCSRNPSRVERAVLLVRNALHGRRPAEPTPRSVAAARVYHSRVYRAIYVLAVVGQLCLAFVEPPSSVALGRRGRGLVTILDFGAMGVVAVDLLLQLLHHGFRVWSRRGWVRLKAVVLVAMAVNLIATAASGRAVPYILRCLRPVFLVERLRNVRQVTANIAYAAPRIFNVLVLLLLHLTVFSVLGYVLFAGVSEGQCSMRRIKDAPFCSTFDPECSSYFNSLQGTMIQLFEVSAAPRAGAR